MVPDKSAPQTSILISSSQKSGSEDAAAASGGAKTPDPTAMSMTPVPNMGETPQSQRPSLSVALETAEKVEKLCEKNSATMSLLLDEFSKDQQLLLHYNQVKQQLSQAAGIPSSEESKSAYTSQYTSESQGDSSSEEEEELDVGSFCP